MTSTAISLQVRSLLPQNWAHQNAHDACYMSSMLTCMRLTQASEVTRATTSLHPPHTHTPTPPVASVPISLQVRSLLPRNWAHQNAHDVCCMSSMLTHMRHTQESEVTRAATSLHPPHTHTYSSRNVYGDIFASTQPPASKLGSSECP